MLPKKNRITRQQWETIAKASKKVVFEWGIVRVDGGEAMRTSSLQVSVVVSKKVAKLSVDRHIIKRFIYSLFDTKREVPNSFMIHVSKWKFDDQEFLKQVVKDLDSLF